MGDLASQEETVLHGVSYLVKHKCWKRKAWFC